MIVAGKDCQDCIYYEPIDKFYNKCTARDKRYCYGQWVPCEDKKPLEVQLLFEQKKQEVEQADQAEQTKSTETIEVDTEKYQPKKRRTRKKKG